MARKKKGQLPSGSIRIQKCVGRRPDGSRIMKSFTGATRDDAETLWKQYDLTPHEEAKTSLTVSEAVQRYIKSKEHVLSPSTLKAYHSALENHIKETDIGRIDINAITITDIQIWISNLSVEHSPKTVRNLSALLRSSLEMFLPDFRYKVTLPQKKPSDLYCPSDADIRRLIDEIRENDLEMYRAVLLAAFGPMRRSEICALTSDDIKGNMVTVNKALVYDETGKLVVKSTKTAGSNRVIEYPSFVIEALSGVDGPIITSAPDVLSNRFKRIVKRIGGPSFRFHDLRHFAASFLHAINVPERYILQRGGWTSDGCFRRVYRNIIDLEEKKQTKKIIKNFERVSHV